MLNNVLNISKVSKVKKKNLLKKIFFFSKDAKSGLDLGCGTGRSSFELARVCERVVGIDYSEAFIKVCQELKENGKKEYFILEEGSIFSEAVAEVDSNIDRTKVQFFQGDACNLKHDELGSFDVVLLANLIDRLYNPMKCLTQLHRLVNSGGILVITSPYTWLEDFTPKENWLQKGSQNTLDELKVVLQPYFDFQENYPLPFLIRETRRKFSWTVAECSVWKRKN